MIAKKGEGVGVTISDPIKSCDESYRNGYDDASIHFRAAISEKIILMEDYIEQVVEPGLKSADKLDDFRRMQNYYNGQASAYKHAIALCKKARGDMR